VALFTVGSLMWHRRVSAGPGPWLGRWPFLAALRRRGASGWPARV